MIGLTPNLQNIFMRYHDLTGVDVIIVRLGEEFAFHLCRQDGVQIFGHTTKDKLPELLDSWGDKFSYEIISCRNTRGEFIIPDPDNNDAM